VGTFFLRYIDFMGLSNYSCKNENNEFSYIRKIYLIR
jgi:hypothetical protein